ncbi:MAG: TA system antitoxin ParD family protein [Alphaproteobacteria bacterium]
MATTIKLSDDIVNEAKRYGAVYRRSTPKQIEYWSNIGKIAEENPDLSYNFIKDILLAKAELEDQQVTPYKFG